MHMRAMVKVPFLRVPDEEYDLRGQMRSYNRRDLRKGEGNELQVRGRVN